MNSAGAKRADDRRWRPGVLAVFGTLAVLTGGVPAQVADDAPGRIERITLKTEASSTKVIIMLSRPLPFEVRVLDGDAARKSGRRLVLDFENTTLAPEAATPIKVDDGLVQQIRPGQFTARTARLVLDLASDTKHSVDAYETPPHVTVAITGTPTSEAAAAATPEPDGASKQGH